MAVDPNNYNLMYASSWDKDRKAWNFRGSGEGSAIYKSTDAGNTWAKVSGEGSGFPTGEGVGRIGVAIYDENTVYATVEPIRAKNKILRPPRKNSSPYQLGQN